MPWIVLVIAALLELVWATALKQSEGFTRLWPSVIGLSVALLSVVVLSVALRDLPVGTAYAVWVGLGSLGVAVTGMIALGESVTPARVACLGLILIGVIGLKVVEG
ncbi:MULTISPECIES: DMT family transporter [Actinomadura]|uniref:QacE family quaternary ammonium compound efflux SMR transporter n=1 Tax=Actinomadura litoris TaxID=2678616 RepID=A0A7K1L4R0_9ACTN|nr:MULTISPECIES: SMR family transporter [Actinomadura]MBT2212446.1 QacE family quaternary ammonium compound efflux SMR transporter [Actinomadura sp. NEAU-AAG7]MUN39424.1 QacE family quaternary ammonium compound efflux SMR transporter [Actinomadura litoris]